MRIFYLIVFIFYLWSRCAQCSIEDEYVDPLDILNYDRITKSMKKPKISYNERESIQNDRCIVFLSRFINMLLKNTGISKLNSNSDDRNKELKSYASVTLSTDDLLILESMVYSKDIDYTEIDRILTGMLSPVEQIDFKFHEINNSLDTSQIKEALYWILIGSFSILLLFFVFHYIGHFFSITFFVIIIFALAFASTWYTMYTKAEITRSVYLETLPLKCKPSYSWSNWFTRNNNLEDCIKYKEAIHLNPLYSIPLTEVIAEMLTKFMLKPLECLGESIYIFNKSALKDFPYWAQLILVPIIVIIIIKIIFLSCALLIGRSLSMKSIFGYGSTTIGSKPPSNNRESVTSDRRKNSSHLTTSAQHVVNQSPEMPKFNFNINLFHPNPNIDQNNSGNNPFFSFGNKPKIKYSKEDYLLSMLKDKDIDSVDCNNPDNFISKIPRHRTLSI